MLFVFIIILESRWPLFQEKALAQNMFIAVTVNLNTKELLLAMLFVKEFRFFHARWKNASFKVNAGSYYQCISLLCCIKMTAISDVLYHKLRDKKTYCQRLPRKSQTIRKIDWSQNCLERHIVILKYLWPIRILLYTVQNVVFVLERKFLSENNNDVSCSWLLSIVIGIGITV